jgi:O-antigen/teichoic acid export membrane protein
MSFRKSLAWTAGGQLGFFLIQFSGSVVLARLLTPYEFGVNALANAVVGVLSIVQSIGLGSYLVREAELTDERIDAVFTINLILSSLIAAAIVALAFAGDLVATDVNVRDVLLIVALSPLVGMFGTVPFAMLERAGNFRIISLLNLVRVLVATATTIALALLDLGFYSIAVGQLAASVVHNAALILAAPRPGERRRRLSVAEWRVLTAFGSQMIAIHGVNTLAGRLGEVIIGRILGLQSLALYNRASAIFLLFWENVHLVIARVVFAEMAREKREGRSLRPFYLGICEMMSAGLWPLFTGAAVFAAPMIRIVYGDQWVAAAPAFQMLALSAVVLISTAMTWEVFVVSNATDEQAKIEVFRAGGGLILFTVGALFSVTAAASARVGDAILSLFLYRPRLQKMTDTTLADMMPIYARSGLLTLLAVLPAIALVEWRGAAATRLPVLEMVGAALAGGALWAVGLWLLDHPLFREATRLARRRMQAA